MTDATLIDGDSAAQRTADASWSRGLLLAALVTGASLGAATAIHSGATASPADVELARLLRFMALLKAVLAAGAAAAIWWRFSTPAPLVRLAGYLLAVAAMAAGPGLIWGMAHVGWGALLLHGGLLAALILLWRDPAVAAKLAEAAASRRRTIAARGETPGVQRGGGLGKARTSPV